MQFQITDLPVQVLAYFQFGQINRIENVQNTQHFSIQLNSPTYSSFHLNEPHPWSGYNALGSYNRGLFT